jgi:hypothetical protein
METCQDQWNLYETIIQWSIEFVRHGMKIQNSSRICDFYDFEWEN